MLVRVRYQEVHDITVVGFRPQLLFGLREIGIGPSLSTNEVLGNLI